MVVSEAQKKANLKYRQKNQDKENQRNKQRYNTDKDYQARRREQARLCYHRRKEALQQKKVFDTQYNQPYISDYY